VQADPAEDLGNLSALSLTDLIIKTGIHDAIAKKLNEKGKLTRNAIAEGIINNVRKTIIREQLTDPKFYEEMSKLLEDLIKQSRQDAGAYEQFLDDAEALVRRLAQKHNVAGVPAVLHGHAEAIVLYRNLPSDPRGNADEQEQRAVLALKIDQAMREKAPSGWKGDPAREAQVLNALYPIMNRDREATRAIFEIIKQQAGYG
jgi:type I restriction enzyme R subunit